MEKIIRENSFEQKSKKPRLKFKRGLALMALQQLGPGWFVMEELWTRGSILRHFRVNKREKDDLEVRILSGQFIF